MSLGIVLPDILELYCIYYKECRSAYLIFDLLVQHLFEGSAYLGGNTYWKLAICK